MSTKTRRPTARLSIRLPESEKELVEQAAAVLGQTVDELAATVLGRAARAALGLQSTTSVSRRDAKMLLALLDDETVQPNEALKQAARRYRQIIKKTE